MEKELKTPKIYVGEIAATEGKKLILKNVNEIQTTTVSNEQLQDWFKDLRAKGYHLEFDDPDPNQENGGFAFLKIVPNEPAAPAKQQLKDKLDTSIPIKDEFKYPRAVRTHLRKPAPTIFDEIDAQENGAIIIDGLKTKDIKLAFEGFKFAVVKLLQIQATQSKNPDGFGIKRRRSKGLSEQLGHDVYSCEMYVSLNDICRAAYGENFSYEQRKKMHDLIHCLQWCKVQSIYQEKTVELKLVNIIEKVTDNKTGAICFDMIVNGIFSDLTQGYGLLPQDTIKRISETTRRMKAAHLKLIELAALQGKKPFSRTFSQLVQDLQLEDAFEKDRGRTENEIIKIIEDVERAKIEGAIEYHKIEYATSKRGRKYPCKVIFY